MWLRRLIAWFRSNPPRTSGSTLDELREAQQRRTELRGRIDDISERIRADAMRADTRMRGR